MRRFLTGWLPQLVTSALPELLAGSAQESRVRTPGLHAGVEVVTDRWGIPHLRAESLDDLYFAWGWVHARDRLWQMVHARAAGDGQTHRWLGNSALRADGGAQLFRLRERAHAIERGLISQALSRFNWIGERRRHGAASRVPTGCD